jgi:ElaB/YqjD/DUF883 family membrane-anchored ribosome-binding protein
MDARTTEKLTAELRAVVREAEALMRAAAVESGEQLRQAGEITREAVGEIDEQVRKNPWAAVGIAAGVGLLIGLLLARK